MARKKHTPDVIIRKLRQAEVLLGEGQGRRFARAGGDRADVLPVEKHVWGDES